MSEAAVAQLRHGLSGVGESGTRHLVERLALALQASVLLRVGSPAAGLFLRSRLVGEHGLALGTFPADAEVEGVIERVMPG